MILEFATKRDINRKNIKGKPPHGGSAFTKEGKKK